MKLRNSLFLLTLLIPSLWGCSPESGTTPPASTGGSPGGSSSGGSTGRGDGGTTEGTTSGLPVESGSLQTVVADMTFIQKNTDGFTVPSGSDQTQFRLAFDNLLQNNLSAAKSGFAVLHLDLVEFHDVGGATFYLVRENAGFPLRGWGFYVVNPSPSRALAIEAPHPLFDFSTEDEAAQVFLTLNTRALLIAGAHRCANATEASTCSGPVNQCGATAPRISDASHATQQVFQTAHASLMDSDPLLVAVALHGFSQGAGEPDSYVSDGTTLASGPGTLANDFAARLNSATGQSDAALSCNDGGPGASSGFCGTLDVQGRYANQSEDACTVSSPGASNRFLHIEQSMDLRDTTTGTLSPANVIQALEGI